MLNIRIAGAAALACLILAAPAHAQIGQPEPPIEGPGCPRAGTTSPRSSERATVTFSNAERPRLSLYWVDFNGSVVEYRQLRRGQSYTVDTFVRHVWVVLDNNGDCVSVLRVPPGGGTFAC
jgi:hypothetical protein